MKNLMKSYNPFLSLRVFRLMVSILMVSVVMIQPLSTVVSSLTDENTELYSPLYWSMEQYSCLDAFVNLLSKLLSQAVYLHPPNPWPAHVYLFAPYGSHLRLFRRLAPDR